jgi:hypothetical protein
MIGFFTVHSATSYLAFARLPGAEADDPGLARKPPCLPTRSALTLFVTFSQGGAVALAPRYNLFPLGSLVLDTQGLQQLAVNHSGDWQSLRRLERPNRLLAAGANFSVYRAVVITALSKCRLH